MKKGLFKFWLWKRVSSPHDAPRFVAFGDLTEGDRFISEYDVLWTKVGRDVARKHSQESINLGLSGYGYRDSFCKFDLNEVVRFIAPNDDGV